MRFLLVTVPFLKADAMALYPFILIQKETSKHDENLLRHEQIHLLQQIEMLIVPFYIWYILNYVINRFKYKAHTKAYQLIIFEREAYAQEHNDVYISQRKFWAWTGY